MRKALRTTILIAAATLLAAAPSKPSPDAGSLDAIDKEGRLLQPCPLKRTDVKASISGFMARVTVTQNFENPLNERIEAVYTFPLPNNAAVDDMTMWVGDRVIKGKIKPREEARAIYDAARNSGRTASMLEQERPNIFTQSVANIRPGEKVKIVISYVERLPYEAGTYEFVFPMVVGPRYIPGKQVVGKQAGGWSPDTNRVPDASRITPNVAIPGTRAGHDITMQVDLDAGVPIDTMKSTSHDVDVQRKDSRHASIKLKDLAVIPNKDFILKYDVAGKKVEDAVLSHRSDRGGFFSLILQPPEVVNPAEAAPKELVFVVDTSGSMNGFPIEKSKEVMRMALTSMNPRDTFNIITFAGDTRILFSQPVEPTAENVAKAREFIEGHRGAGGTEMMKAIRAALEPTRSQQHIRVVAFLTDGYVGNDMEIVAEVKKYSNARVFSFGIGSSVNRFLLDKMAEFGRGEVEYVSLNDDGSAAAKRFYERVRNPLLTDIKLDWGGLQVSEVYPKQIPDLFSAKPVVIYGRYNGPGKATVRLSGKTAGRDFTRNISVDLPANDAYNDVLASLWARTKIEDLMSQDYGAMHRGDPSTELRNSITKLALDFRLMSQFTAFVAVEERTVTEGGQPKRIEVPVEMPEGVSYRGVFGEKEMAAEPMQARALGGMNARRKIGIVGGYSSSAPMPSIAPPPVMNDSSRREAQVVKPQGQQGQQGQANPAYKLHPDLMAVKSPSAKVEVKIYLTDNSAGTLQALKDAGLELVRHDASGSYVVGRVLWSKLDALTKLAAVRYISPNQP